MTTGRTIRIDIANEMVSAKSCLVMGGVGALEKVDITSERIEDDGWR